MDSVLSTLGLAIFGITFSIYSVIVESQSQSASSRIVPPSPPPPPPASPFPPPPSPSPRPPSPSLKPPPPHSPPPSPHSPPPPHHFPSPHHLDNEYGRPKANKSPSKPFHNHYRSPPRPATHQMNGGKKIGLLFAGVAGIMQIGVVGFLVFKRRQLLRTKDAFETSA